jgi:valyl-tRNA synthetase
MAEEGRYKKMTQENSVDMATTYDAKATEEKWQERWEKDGVYIWDRSAPRSQTFAVDTPPPTVSGSLHIGHVFSYSQTDFQARFERMRGKNVFYPMGWDDNGLPTERRVENVYNIRCDINAPYNPNYIAKPATDAKAKPETLARRNFIEACSQLTLEDEKVFKRLFTHLGLSVDWSLEYATIDPHCRKISQFSFLDLVEKGQVYSKQAPTFWDVTFQTAVAQAELEDRQVEGFYHDLRFRIEDTAGEEGEIIISTTRPELLAACIAVVAHPDDARYQQAFGKFAITPLFNVRVPILPSEHADPEKGTGILMVCTFGDNADVDYWKQSNFPIRQIIGMDGKIRHVEWGKDPFSSQNPARAAAAYEKLVGQSVTKARQLIVEMLTDPSYGEHGQTLMRGAPQKTVRAVKFYEKGKHPIEIITTRQWFINILDHKNELIEQGHKIKWHPAHMETRYTHWVEGLNQDWCISRQRYFGVAFPVWYPIDQHGNIQYEKPIYAQREQLPVDPASDTPDGYQPEMRGKPGGFYGEMDVMDTWATSSLSPQIATHWGIDAARHESLFPMDVRPQSHEIIRTWAFYTIVKAYLHENKIPWKNIAISGWILDPDRKKMSKSKGNVVTPEEFLQNYSADAVRYWAARAKLGIDTAFDEKVFKMGKKLTTKLFNAAKFVMLQLQGTQPYSMGELKQVSAMLDKVWLGRMLNLIDECTRSFNEFDYATSLKTAEDLFWNFCDHYVEMVKGRTYRASEAEKRSAQLTLDFSLDMFLRLFAPIFPYLCEEIFSWRYAGEKGATIHRNNWPDAQKVREVLGSAFFAGADEMAFSLGVETLSLIRGVKSQNQVKLKWPINALSIKVAAAHAGLLEAVSEDVLRAGNVNPAGFKLMTATPEETGSNLVTLVEAVLGEKEEQEF